MNEDEIDFSTPEKAEPDAPSLSVVPPWKVLIVDDDIRVHEVTQYTLGKLTFRGRPLQFLSAMSGMQAREIFLQELDIAVAFVDVVMETVHSGLDLVRFVREELGNRSVSLILRTGQPGYAPEQEVIVEYEINDYKSKPELTSAKLITAMVAALRAYANNSQLVDLTRQLESQLLLSEKMASLGLLVANVAHEINTPIGSIKSSGEGIAGSLDEALNGLPRLLDVLDQEHRDLFIRLIDRARVPTDSLNTRETRAAVMTLTAELEVAGITEARQKAAILVKLNAQSVLADILPLLVHAECSLILNTANNLAAIISSARNINIAVDRVVKIILALKSFSRFSRSDEMIEAQLQDGLEAVLTIYHHQIKQGTEVVRHYEDIPALHCLPDELNQVWTNLIHNALQAMDSGGAGVRTLTVGIHRKGNEAVVSVSDTGCGIPEEIRGKIFDVFFTTKPVGVGSGLGLDIVRKIIDKHQGRIVLQSEVGVGSTFNVYLPYPKKI